MSRSYWLPAIAIGLVLSNAANAEGVSRDTRRDAARNQSGPIPIENIFPTSDFPGVNELQRIAHALEAQVADSQSPEEQDRAERGVEAAERLADWTPGILAVAFLEIVITGFGVFLLAGTLGHTRRTADAAEKTLAETTKNARLELRAYLSVEPAGINRLYGETAEALGHVMVTNVGKLPAKNVQVVVRLLASQDRNFAAEELSDDLTISRTIQPGAHMRQGSKDYVAVANARHRINNIFIWGIVRYDDGYGIRRYTRFCHRYAGSSYYRGNAEIAGMEGVIIETEKARYHTTGNDAD
jgi:hypothetical protein